MTNINLNLINPDHLLGGAVQRDMSAYDQKIVVKWFAEHGIYAVPEYRFCDERKWRFDFILAPDRSYGGLLPTTKAHAADYWKLALEVQGGLFTNGRHSRGAALLKEHEKLNAAACAGWRILYTIPDNLCMPETVETIKKALTI
jgi:hypothetical protein